MQVGETRGSVTMSDCATTAGCASGTSATAEDSVCSGSAGRARSSRPRRATKGDAIAALLRLKAAPPIEHDFDDDAASLDVQDAASTASAPMPPPTRRRRNTTLPEKPRDPPAALRAADVREILLSSLEL